MQYNNPYTDTYYKIGVQRDSTHFYEPFETYFNSLGYYTLNSNNYTWRLDARVDFFIFYANYYVNFASFYLLQNKHFAFGYAHSFLANVHHYALHKNFFVVEYF